MPCFAIEAFYRDSIETVIFASYSKQHTFHLIHLITIGLTRQRNFIRIISCVSRTSQSISLIAYRVQCKFNGIKKHEQPQCKRISSLRYLPGNVGINRLS